MKFSCRIFLSDFEKSIYVIYAKNHKLKNMKMQVINRASDFKLVEDYGTGAIPKKLVFSTDGCVLYDARLENGRMIKSSEEGKYIIVFDNPGFNVGRLNVTRYYSEADSDFPDHTYDWQSFQQLNIYIGNCSSDAPDEGVINAYTPIYRGDAGKDADVEAIRMEIDRKAEEVLSAAKAYTDGSTAGLEDAKAYTDERDAVTLENAKTYTDTQDAEMLAAAKSYTDESGASAANVLYFETIADFDNAKSRITEKSLVYIAETDETMVFKPKKYNAKFVACEEWFADAAIIGAEMLGIDLTGKVILTMVLHHFESFMVNGTEMVTGNETANETGICPLLMDANLGDEFEVTFRFKANNELNSVGGEIILAGFVFTPITELILREHDFTAYGDMSAKVFEAYHMFYNICLHKISICTSQKFGELSGEFDTYGLISHRANFMNVMSDGKWRTTPIPEDAYVELSDNDAFGQEFVDGSSETDIGLLTYMTMPKSMIAGSLGLPEEFVHDVELRRIPYIND